MDIFAELIRHQRKTRFWNGDEAAFFKEKSYLLGAFEQWTRFLAPKRPFDVIRANIIIRSLENKKAIERWALSYVEASESDSSIKESMAMAMAELPYLNQGNRKIYVTFFPTSLNDIYSGNFRKIRIAPYKRLLSSFEAVMVDPFDYYGAAIYDSHFTKLVPVSLGGDIAAFYDYDAMSIYFVNAQGRLDQEVALFDKWLIHPKKTNLVQRIEKVAKAYIDNDKEAFYKALEEGELVSKKLLDKVRGHK